MGSRTVKVSDLSGQIVEDETQLAHLVVEQHPEYSEPITLEVLPEEVEGALPEEQHFVALSYFAPGEPNSQRFLMPLDRFNSLFKEAEMDGVLRKAMLAQQEAREQNSRRRRGGTQQTPETRQRIDYTSPEHAGEPHRGTISEAEKAYVRDHLEEVNARLREQGLREIEPTDLEMIKRYSLTPATP